MVWDLKIYQQLCCLVLKGSDAVKRTNSIYKRMRGKKQREEGKKVGMLLSNQKQPVCGIHIYHKNSAMLTLCPLIYKILYHFQAANIKPAVGFLVPGIWGSHKSHNTTGLEDLQNYLARNEKF